MAKFTTRVELINPQPGNYDTLHQEMENRNFTRTITGDDQVTYHLPDAEYNREGIYTREQTLNAAVAAANATGRSSRILVTESNGRNWHNLKSV